MSFWTESAWVPMNQYQNVLRRKRRSLNLSLFFFLQRSEIIFFAYFSLLAGCGQLQDSTPGAQRIKSLV